MQMRLFPNKVVLLCSISIVAVIITFMFYERLLDQFPIPKVVHKLNSSTTYVEEYNVSCYDKNSNAQSLKVFDYNEATNSIFFHETSCFGNSEAILKPRQACAVESAARMNPNMTVYLSFLSPSRLSKESESLYNHLMKYKNIKVRRIMIKNYIKDTPIEQWFLNLDIMKTKWPNIQMADIIRYVTLWKYGGIYLDLDVVVMKSFENLTNFVGIQDSYTVAAGVLGFSKYNNLGRKMAHDCLVELQTKFNGNIWGHNAPGVITRVLFQTCQVSSIDEMTAEKCQGFNIFKPSFFYPIHYGSWRKYFETDNVDFNMKLIKNAYAIHVWNKLSKHKDIRVGEQVPYGLVAAQFCPEVYHNCGTIF